MDADEEAEEEEEDEDDQEEEEEEIEPETGPPILTPLSEDGEVSKGVPAWSTRLSSKLLPENAHAVVSSNYWPGAHTIAAGT